MKKKPTYQELEKEIENLRQKLEISENNERFQNYFDKNKAVMLQINSATKQITKANEAAVNFYGYSKNELLQKTVSDLNTLSPNKINIIIKEVINRKSNFFEFQHKLSNGKIKHVEIYVSPFNIGDETNMIATVLDITERKKAEQDLKASKEKYRILTETMKDVVIKIAITGELLYVSPATEIFGGYKPEEEIGNDMSKYFAVENDYLRAVKLIKEVIETHKSGSFEFMYKHKNKAPFPVEHTYMPLIKDNKVYAIQMILRDISDRKHAEQALKVSEERFRSIMKSMDDIVFMLDKENRFVLVNTASRDLYLKPEMFLGKKHSEVIPKHVDDLYNAAMINVKKGKTEEYEYFLDMPDKTRCYALKLSPIYNNSKFDGTVSVVRDITNRKKAEQIIMDNNNKLQSLNKKVVKNEQRLKTNRNLKEFVEEEEWSRILQQTAKRKLNETSTYDLIISLANNSKKHLTVTASPDYDINKNIIGTIGVFRDITERKKSEQALKESETKLRESNATKDKFFSIIAHDLKSPFNAILGFSEILAQNHKKYDDEKREKIIKYVNNSANNTFKLLENLLTWSRSQSGVIRYSPEKLHLKILLFETILSLQEQAIKKNISILDTIFENDIVFADKNMIETVLRNLISNAIKFTNNGGNIIISSKKQNDSNFIEISIKDSGVGIPKGTIDDLFRIDKNTSTQGTDNEVGTGLGLILCKEFVEKHGGKIWVESEENEGSIFSFTISKINDKN